MFSDTDLKYYARKCAVRYLEKVKGYTIEAEDFHGFVVALDEKQLVFASCGAAVSDSDRAMLRHHINCYGA